MESATEITSHYLLFLNMIPDPQLGFNAHWPADDNFFGIENEHSLLLNIKNHKHKLCCWQKKDQEVTFRMALMY